MNILITNPNIWFGGAQKVLIHEARELMKRGHEVFILTTMVDRSEQPELLAQLKIIEVNIPLLRRVGSAYLPLENKITLAKNLFHLRQAIKRIIRERNIQLVNVHQPPVHWVCAKLPVPVVWTCFEPISLWPSKKPYFIIGNKKSVHGFDKVWRWFFERADRFFIRRYLPHVVAISESVQRDLKTLYGITATVLYCPIDSVYTRGNPGWAQSELGLGEKFGLVQIGHLKAVKNQDCSIRAVEFLRNKIPNIKLILVGEGPDRLRLERYVNEMRLGSIVTLAGRIGDEQVASTLAASKILLLPARHQTWGLVAFEALAAGALPIAVGDSGAAPILRKYDMGLVADSRPESFAEKVFFAYNNQDSTAQMVRRGQEFVRANLSYNSYAAKLEGLFTGIITRSKQES